MDYKNNIFYIIGSGIVALSVIDLVVTFAMMGMGFDNAIIWFFIGCVTLVIGLFMSQTAKRRCEEGYYEFKRPSKLVVLKENFSSVFGFLFKRGVIGAVAIILVICSVAVTAILGIRCAKTAFDRGGPLNAGYNYSLSEAERYKSLMEEQLQEGNDIRAENFKAAMEKAIKDSEEYLKIGQKLTEKLNKQLPPFYYSLAASASMVAFYITVIVLYKRKNLKGDAL